MESFFLNSMFVYAAAALISVPIIIHLINRLRFKRIRWAAMEFLLKAQKRNRRRLIIEQILLLALRCLLVALVGILVMRFTGFSLADGWGSKQPMHMVLLDDSLSMSDEIKGAKTRSTFAAAKEDVLLEKIVKGIQGSTAGDKLVILPLSKAGSDEDLRTFERLADDSRYTELKNYINELKPTKLHLKLADGIDRISKILEGEIKHDVTLHVLSDFRVRDWSRDEGAVLQQKVVDFAKSRNAKVHLVDVAAPDRVAGQSSAPLCHDNVGIVDFRPSTRIVGKDMRVAFSITLANYSDRDVKVRVVICRDESGLDQQDIDFNPLMPVKLDAKGTITSTFVMQFPGREGGDYYASITAHLESETGSKLENDSLAEDNVAHAFVEVRDQVPVLIVDGQGRAGREDDKLGKDSFFLREALLSPPDSRFKVEFGDMLGGSGGIATKALERGDLRNFSTIILANVRDLTPKQLANLEAYVNDGGGLAVFLGPDVSAQWYNKNFYKSGNGLFPVQLKEPYYPPPDRPELDIEPSGAPMLLLRDDLFPTFSQYPIFGAIFEDKGRRDSLTSLQIKRYFRAASRPTSAQALELATLPNEKPVTAFAKQVLDLVRDKIPAILQNEDNAKYRKAFIRYRGILEKMVSPTSEEKPYFLAEALNRMLTDKARENQEAEFPDMEKFWDGPDAAKLKAEIQSLRDEVRYGDPFVMTRNFGKGKVVAIMTTAGKAWSEWPGGRGFGPVTYTPFVWEMQNYLSRQGSEINLTVGTPVEIKVATEGYKLANRRLKMVRTYQKAIRGKKAEVKLDSELNVEDKNGVLHYFYPRNYEPGLYVANLMYADAKENDKPLASWAHVFNVDTAREGPLQRVSTDDVKTGILDKGEKRITFGGVGISPDELVSKRRDFSETPWLFLLFLAVLIAEQALAVHLSFHLKGEAQAFVPTLRAQQAA